MAPTVQIQRKRHIEVNVDLGSPKKVEAGFPSGSDSEIVNIVIWNHYGTSRGIPARPFILLAMKKNEARYRNFIKDQAFSILRGETTQEQVLNRLGAIVASDIQQSITDLKTPPNAPSTIRAKGSSNPLIDTGRMRSAVTFRVTDANAPSRGAWARAASWARGLFNGRR